MITCVIDMSRSPVTYTFSTPADEMEVISVLWEDSAKIFLLVLRTFTIWQNSHHIHARHK